MVVLTSTSRLIFSDKLILFRFAKSGYITGQDLVLSGGLK